ncbi:hypothetical protein Q1695_005757 [Nippostrongylus brasiliensis]|nr:hypothetical protein Q1695_005757 [Nippostrongylus brasiliensis]
MPAMCGTVWVGMHAMTFSSHSMVFSTAMSTSSVVGACVPVIANERRLLEVWGCVDFASRPCNLSQHGCCPGADVVEFNLARIMVLLMA